MHGVFVRMIDETQEQVVAAWNRRASPEPLTNEQIRDIINKTVEGVTVSEAVLFRAAARAIEKAHGIGAGK